MYIYSTRKFILLLLVSLLIGLVVVLGTLPAVNYYNHYRPPNIGALGQQIVYYFGEDGNPLFNLTVTRLGTGLVPVERLDSSPGLTPASYQTLKMTGRSDSFVIVSGDWIAKRVNDNQTQTFLYNLLSKGGKIVAVGGPTHTLFDAVIASHVGNQTNAAILPQPTDRPCTGFWLKTTILNNGGASLYPSYLSQNTTDPDSMIEGWNSWLTGLSG
jgi:hypothetical protein